MSPKMKCCVPLCRSTGENYPFTVPVRPYGNDSQEQLTFSRFPTSPAQRTAWLKMLGLTEFDLPPGAVVCSKHFKKNDFTVLSGGIVKLSKDSVPLQFCMICLASGNSKMYPMDQNHLEKAYTIITGISVSYIRDKINTLPRLCAECAQRLVNCDGLRDKSLRAYRSLMQIIHNDKVLTLDNLKSIDRVEKQLVSNIAKRTFEPDHYDCYEKHSEEDSTICSEKEFSSSDSIENTDMDRLKNDDFEIDSTDYDVEYLSESDDFQNDNNIKKDNRLNYNDVKNDDIINDNVQVNTTNTNDVSNNCDAGPTDNVVQVINQDKIDENVKNAMNNEDVLLLIIGSADGVKSMEDDNKHDIDNDIDDGDKDGFDNYTNDHNNVLLNNNYGKISNRSKDENKSKNRVILRNIIFLEDSKPSIQNKDLIPEETNDTLQVLRVYSNKKRKNINNAKTIINNQYRNKVKSLEESKENFKLNNRFPNVFQETEYRFNIQNSGQLSSKSLVLKVSVPRPKMQRKEGNPLKKPESCVPKPKKQKKPKPCIPKPKKQKKPKQCIPKPKKQKKPKPCVPKPKILYLLKLEEEMCKFFKKTTLTHEEQLADVQRRQYTERYKSYPYKCDICFTGRGSVYTYNTHMDKHTDIYGKFECALCGLRRRTRTDLIRHLRSHAERFSCKMCNFVTCYRTKASCHARWHRGRVYSCPHCGATFKIQSSYLSHVRLKHPSDFVCPLCGFSFVSKHGVKAHIQLSHRAEDVQKLCGPSCEQCGVRFASQDAYDTHVAVSPKHVSLGTPKRNDYNKSQQSCHRDAAMYEVWGKCFQTNDFEKPSYTCDMCHKSFISLVAKVTHMAHVHNQVLRFTNTRKLQGASVLETVVDDPSAVVEETVVDDPSAVVEETVVDDPSAVVEETVVDDPSAFVEETVVDDPSAVVEETVVDDPSAVVEETFVDDANAVMVETVTDGPIVGFNGSYWGYM